MLECLAHIVDAEIVAAARYRWILAHDEPELIGYDQDLWVDRLHQPVEDAGRCSSCSSRCGRPTWCSGSATRRSCATAWGSIASAARRSFGLLFTMIAGHDRFHVAQAERALASLRATR